ncbi:low-density lipoprotein receptor-like [Liolophura sinensis]|uniref:low-density lipoprotein receptor-like n=1 Tax=Liolophura sinensis TaxID=3198878 RepID=UPI0031594761
MTSFCLRRVYTCTDDFWIPWKRLGIWPRGGALQRTDGTIVWPLNSTTARVICNSFGYSFGFVGPAEVIPGGRSVWLKDIACTGDELDIVDCPHTYVEADSCDVIEDSVVHCSNSRLPVEECKCENGGHCIGNQMTGDYQQCKCPYGYTGNLCQHSYLTTKRPWTTRIPGFHCDLEVFTCHSGACVPHHWVCNGRYDCPDGSDESPYLCTPDDMNSIPPLNNSATTTDWWKPTTTEEWNLSTTTTPVSTMPVTTDFQCPSSQFLCGDGITCRSLFLKCNGQPDCLDGSDERGCVDNDGEYVRVFHHSQWRPLCGNGSDVDNDVGRAVCIYLGYEKLSSVSTDYSNIVDNGTAIYPRERGSHFLGNYRSTITK